MVAMATARELISRCMRFLRIAPVEAPPVMPAPSGPAVDRVYTRREIVLPSGRFASMSPILVIDVVLSKDPDDLVHMVKLASCCVAIDGVPLSLTDAFHMEGSEFIPVITMLQAESQSMNSIAKGFV